MINDLALSQIPGNNTKDRCTANGQQNYPLYEASMEQLQKPCLVSSISNMILGTVGIDLLWNDFRSKQRLSCEPVLKVSRLI